MIDIRFKKYNFLLKIIFFFRRVDNCYRCMVIHNKHYNVLQYKESTYKLILFLFFSRKECTLHFLLKDKNERKKFYLLNFVRVFTIKSSHLSLALLNYSKTYFIC